MSSRYPVLVTTSKLLTTGVDIQTVKYIVLDTNINSMTEFKQIFGRGHRIREDLGKLFFLFLILEMLRGCLPILTLTGPVNRDDEYMPDENGNIHDSDSDSEFVKEDPKDYTIDNDSEPGKRKKYYVGDVEVSVLKQRVQYIDKTETDYGISYRLYKTQCFE